MNRQPKFRFLGGYWEAKLAFIIFGSDRYTAEDGFLQDIAFKGIGADNGIARIRKTGKVIFAEETVNPFVTAGRIVYPVIGNGPFQPFVGMRPEPISSLDIFYFSIQIELKNILPCSYL